MYCSLSPNCTSFDRFCSTLLINIKVRLFPLDNTAGQWISLFLHNVTRRVPFPVSVKPNRSGVTKAGHRKRKKKNPPIICWVMLGNFSPTLFCENCNIALRELARIVSDSVGMGNTHTWGICVLSFPQNKITLPRRPLVGAGYSPDGGYRLDRVV